MTWRPEANSYEEARYLQQNDNKKVNNALMWKLKQGPCTDCKLRWHPRVMTFDHVDRKSMKYTAKGRPVKINTITYWNPSIFRLQIKKLDVVCLNCHRIREDKRDMNNPMVKPDMKEHFQAWFDKCIGALVQKQVWPHGEEASC